MNNIFRGSYIDRGDQRQHAHTTFDALEAIVMGTKITHIVLNSALFGRALPLYKIVVVLGTFRKTIDLFQLLGKTFPCRFCPSVYSPA